MPSDPPLSDLLIVGGLTVDHLDDGSTAPGGSVLHATRAARRAGLSVAAVTVAGPERAARAGLAELREACVAVESCEAAATITYRHREEAGGRRLWLEDIGGEIASEAVRAAATSRAVVYAPVARELDAAALQAARQAPVRAAILQGWLRHAVPGDEATPLAPAALPDTLLAALRPLDAVVASREDLLAVGTDPQDQLAALRSALGAGPLIVVTGGPEGAWLDGPTEAQRPRHLPAPWRVEGVPTVGAGDALAALLAAGMAASAAREWDSIAVGVMRSVAELLDARRG